ncbi:MAG: hypothetical protein ACRD21_18345, partial [Vicinamibacteria bacterium]
MRLGMAAVLSFFAGTIPVLEQPASDEGSVSLARERLSIAGVRIESVRHRDRDAIRLIEADDTRVSGIAIVQGVSFRDGVIEIDVAGQRGPYALPEDRGFIGVAFRVSRGGDRFEYVYLRPENGRAADPVRRSHSA